MVGADTRGCLGSSVVSQGLTTDRTPEILLVRFPIKKHILIAFSPNVRVPNAPQKRPYLILLPPRRRIPLGAQSRGLSVENSRGSGAATRGRHPHAATPYHFPIRSSSNLAIRSTRSPWRDLASRLAVDAPMAVAAANQSPCSPPATSPVIAPASLTLIAIFLQQKLELEQILS